MEVTLKVRKKLSTTFDALLEKLAVIAFACVIGIMIITSANVIMRYFLDKPIGWSQEISIYLMLYTCFLAAAYVLKRERHVIMEIIISRLNPIIRVSLNFITSCFMIVICLVIIWYGVDLTLELYQRGAIAHESLETPKFLLIGIIPIGMFFLFIQTIRRTLGYWGWWKEIRNEDRKS